MLRARKSPKLARGRLFEKCAFFMLALGVCLALGKKRKVGEGES